MFPSTGRCFPAADGDQPILARRLPAFLNQVSSVLNRISPHKKLSFWFVVNKVVPYQLGGLTNFHPHDNLPRLGGRRLKTEYKKIGCGVVGCYSHIRTVSGLSLAWQDGGGIGAVVL